MNDNIALGLTAKQWLNLLSGTDQEKAAKALNYLDGKHEEEVIKVLNDPNSGRLNWKAKGFIPRYRNLTKMIVEKSALLFSNTLPTFEVYTTNTTQINESDTQKLYDELNKIPFQEIMNNADQLLRLLKTVFILYQYDSINQELVVDILHRGNCQVIVDGTKQVVGMIYTTGERSYRVFTTEEIIDLMLSEQNNEPVVLNVQPNPYGIVPVSVFYDLRIPRNGLWVDPEYDLINFNEAYNLHLTDSDFSMKWAKLPTLVMIDCDVETGGYNNTQEVLSYGDTLPRTMPASPNVSGGPGSIIHLTSSGQGTPSVQYIAPTVAVAPIEEVYDGWCKSIAQDWSVRINTEGNGGVTSGFQLVVEEMPNLELRNQRQRMYEGGFKRAWTVMRKVLNTSSPFTFNENTTLFVEFSQPKLPVDQGAQEDVWDKRINSGRASVIDYFKQELGLTEEEAFNKYMEIVKFKSMDTELTTTINNPIVEDNTDTTETQTGNDFTENTQDV